jgi:hypothetical protein
VSHGYLNHLAAQARMEELHRVSEARRAARMAQQTPWTGRLRPESAPPVTLRPGFPDDAEALTRLAQLDSAPPLVPPVLLAECDGRLRAAVSLADGATITDPFYPSAPVVELLRTRAEQLREPQPHPLVRAARAASAAAAAAIVPRRARSSPAADESSQGC